MSKFGVKIFGVKKLFGVKKSFFRNYGKTKFTMEYYCVNQIRSAMNHDELSPLTVEIKIVKSIDH